MDEQARASLVEGVLDTIHDVDAALLAKGICPERHAFVVDDRGLPHGVVRLIRGIEHAAGQVVAQPLSTCRHDRGENHPHYRSETESYSWAWPRRTTQTG